MRGAQRDVHRVGDDMLRSRHVRDATAVSRRGFPAGSRSTTAPGPRRRE